MDGQLDEIQWKSPEFIQERGLHSGNVLEYFALSPFYDRTSNNQVLMMQFQFQQIQIPVGQTFAQYFQSRLLEMVGVEFVVAYTREPDFWVVRKQRRNDPHSAGVLADYYIIGANVYQAPRVYDVLGSRLLSSALSLKNAIEILDSMSAFLMSDGGHRYNDVRIQSLADSSKAFKGETPGLSQTPQTADPLTSRSGPNTAQDVNPLDPSTLGPSGPVDSGTSDISSLVFDLLLNVVADPEKTPIYLDNIPLYGKGSTVELLKVHVHQTDDAPKSKS